MAFHRVPALYLLSPEYTIKVMIDISRGHLLLTYRYSPPGYRPLGLGVCSNAITAAPALSRFRSINAEWVNWGLWGWGWPFPVRCLTFVLQQYWRSSKSKDETTEYRSYEFHGRNYFIGTSLNFNFFQSLTCSRALKYDEATEAGDPFDLHLYLYFRKNRPWPCRRLTSYRGP